MKRLTLVLASLIIVGCGSGGGGSSTVDNSSTAPILTDVKIYDDYFEHPPPKIWRVGDKWNFALYFKDAENDIDHAIAYLYHYDTVDVLWGPYIFDLTGRTSEYSGTDGDVIAEHPGLYIVGFILVDKQGNESKELYGDVRIQD